VEFDPAYLTDSFAVQQSLETPDQRTVSIQIGNELAALGRIDDRTLYNDYYHVRDAREAIIRADQQRLVTAWKQGPAAAGIAPGSGLDLFLQQLIGNVQYQMTQINPGTALAVARMQAEQANMQAQQMMQPQIEGQQAPPPMGAESGGLGGGVAAAAGIRRPGMGMNASLQGQLGGPPQPPRGA
jgi:hypothetical protein